MAANSSDNEKVRVTNLDIMRAIDGIQSRLFQLETWKITQEAAKNAVEAYQMQERSTQDRLDKRKLVKDVTAFLSVLTLLIWAVIEYLSAIHK